MPMNMSDTLTYFALKYDGDFHATFLALQNKEAVDPDLYFDLKKNTHHKHFTIIDNSYLNYFKAMNCPPIVLFYTGNKDLFHSDMPIKEIFLEDGTRAYSSIEPTEQNGKIVFDYVIACENHDQVDKLLEHVKSKGLPLKDQTPQKNREEKVC